MVLNFFKDSVEEFKRLYFPSRKETYTTTLAILAITVIFSSTILLTDFLISKIISLIFGL